MNNLITWLYNKFFITPEIAYRQLVFRHFYNLSEKKIKQLEKIISKNPRTSFLYALHILQRRFPEGEESIAKDPRSAYEYSLKVLNSRFPECEKVISEDIYWCLLYAENVIRNRFYIAEEDFHKFKNMRIGLHYATLIKIGKLQG